jgi:hypothetical protein
MPEEPKSVARSTTLTIHVALIPLLAAILFGLFSVILPRHRWTVWAIPVLIAAGGVVALLAAWPFRQAVRDGVLDALAGTLALASAVTGIAITLMIGYGLALQVAENRYATHSLMFRLTHPELLRQLLVFALVPIAPAVIGVWVANRRATARISLAAMAARFSITSLVLSGLIVGTVLVGAAYHTVQWP